MRFTGKTVEDALNEAQIKLGTDSDKLNYEIIRKPSKGFLNFGVKNAIIDVILVEDLKRDVVENNLKQVKADIKVEADNRGIERLNNREAYSLGDVSEDELIKYQNAAREYLNTVFKDLGYDTETSFSKKGEYIFISIKGKNLGKLIGKRGETLNSLQYLLSISMSKKFNKTIRFIIDIENYRMKREKTLIDLARRLAKRAIEEKKEISLEPMNPSDRKIIHQTLQEIPEIVTLSQGNGEYRYIKIIPKAD